MKLFAAPPAHGRTAERRDPTYAVLVSARNDPGRPPLKKLRPDRQLGLQALDLEPNGAAAGEGERDGARRRVALGEFDREEIERRLLVV